MLFTSYMKYLATNKNGTRSFIQYRNTFAWQFPNMHCHSVLHNKSMHNTMSTTLLRIT